MFPVAESSGKISASQHSDLKIPSYKMDTGMVFCGQGKNPKLLGSLYFHIYGWWVILS